MRLQTGQDGKTLRINKMPEDKNVIDFKTAGMKRAGARDDAQSKGKQFGIGNFFAWAMEKYPKMTLGQLEARMPSLEREYGQEKTMRRERPDEVPTVSSAFDDENERLKAKGIETPDAFEGTKDPMSKGDCEPCDGTGMDDKGDACKVCDGDGEDPGFGGTKAYEDLNRIRKLAGLPMMEEEGSVTKIAIGHVDDEADMLRKELYKIGKYSVELYKMLGELPDGDFPHWWQGKVIKAGEYIGSAKHYLEGELFAPEEESPIPDDKDDLNPSGV